VQWNGLEATEKTTFFSLPYPIKRFSLAIHSCWSGIKAYHGQKLSRGRLPSNVTDGNQRQPLFLRSREAYHLRPVELQDNPDVVRAQRFSSMA